MTTPTGLKPRISPDGLRYKGSAPGSQFGTVTTCSTRSCYWCGVHRSVTSMASQNVCGSPTKVCQPPCSKNVFAKKAAAAPAVRP